MPTRGLRFRTKAVSSQMYRPADID